MTIYVIHGIAINEIEWDERYSPDVAYETWFFTLDEANDYVAKELICK